MTTGWVCAFVFLRIAIVLYMGRKSRPTTKSGDKHKIIFSDFRLIVLLTPLHPKAEEWSTDRIREMAVCAIKHWR